MCNDDKITSWRPIKTTSVHFKVCALHTKRIKAQSYLFGNSKIVIICTWKVGTHFLSIVCWMVSNKTKLHSKTLGVCLCLDMCNVGRRKSTHNGKNVVWAQGKYATSRNITLRSLSLFSFFIFVFAPLAIMLWNACQENIVPACWLAAISWSRSYQYYYSGITSTQNITSHLSVRMRLYMCICFSFQNDRFYERTERERPEN